MKTTQRIIVIFTLAALGGCANYASIRTLGSGIKTVTDDTETIVAADEESCKTAYSLVAEYNEIFPTHQAAINGSNCDDRAKTLTLILTENKAVGAYGSALSSLSQDQYVTTDTDGKSVTATATSLLGGSNSAIPAAISSVFTFIENLALNGYRQHHISEAMTGEPASAFLKIVGDMKGLSDTYNIQLTDESSDLSAVQRALEHNSNLTHEPIATAEMQLRLQGLQNGLKSKNDALAAYAKAVDGLPKAMADAQSGLQHPDAKALISDIVVFAQNAKDAHDKILKAFPKI